MFNYCPADIRIRCEILQTYMYEIGKKVLLTLHAVFLCMASVASYT